MLNILETLESFKNYAPSLSNSLDDIEDFALPEHLVGDIVRFTPYYESDEGGVGIIKKITTCEFKNKEYDPNDPNSELFISLPCAIVVSALPHEQWLDYVPLTNAEVVTLSEIIQEYASALPERDEIELQAVRVGIARKLSDIRATQWDNQRNVSSLPAVQQAVQSEIAS